MEWIPVTCPSCFETFEIPPPDLSEVSSLLDYDCEVCCRPMVLSVYEDEFGDVAVEARSLDDSA
ncbi:MAG: CPXCG motif-containing cysteine-rich protein [Verrucomicrobiales bacterium]